MKKSNKYKLLPHTKEKVYGFDRNAGQVVGWEISNFDIQSYWKYSTGSNIVVGVLDTGCDINHEDIKPNILPGYNAIDDNSNCEDDNGHGTHVAGTIAATNNSLGMVGVAPDVKIIPIKVLNKKGTGDALAISKGILWATKNGCDIITMSLASDGHSNLIDSAIDYAIKNGVVVVCAAGNSGQNHPIMYPANLDTTIAVGSIGRSLSISSFSCTGPELNFFSPGENIFSCAPNNSYTIMSGTSMATPFAVGCIAITLSNIKNYKDYTEKSKLLSILNKNTIKITNSHCGVIQPNISFS